MPTLGERGTGGGSVERIPRKAERGREWAQGHSSRTWQTEGSPAGRGPKELQDARPCSPGLASEPRGIYERSSCVTIRQGSEVTPTWGEELGLRTPFSRQNHQVPSLNLGRPWPNYRARCGAWSSRPAAQAPPEGRGPAGGGEEGEGEEGERERACVQMQRHR